jgi:outer membrane protein, adhesin transport system
MRLMNKVKYPFVIALAVFFIKSTNAQEIYDLSRCITTGLERNFSLQVTRNQEEISKNNYSLGNAGMLPSVNFVNRYGGSINTINQNYSDGEEISASGVHNNFDAAALNLDMSIFRGFQVQNTYKKLGVQSEIGNLNTQMAVENLVARIVSEYNYYIQQNILYENLAYAVSLSRERVRIDEQRYLLGGASKLELLQSLVYLNADSSRYASQSEVLRTSQIRMNELMAAENLGEIILLKDTAIQINESLLYEPLLDRTLIYNTSLQIASKSQIVSELDYKIIKSRFYPYLTATAGYGYNYNGYGAGDLINQHVRGMNYGITLGMNIFDGFNRKRELSNARINIENRNIQYKEVEQEVKADLLTIYYAYQNNIRLLRLEEQNLEVARENLEIALERYKLGSLAGLELREVQKSLLDAEERLIYVKFQTKLAEISLLQISGSILDYL